MLLHHSLVEGPCYGVWGPRPLWSRLQSGLSGPIFYNAAQPVVVLVEKPFLLVRLRLKPHLRYSVDLILTFFFRFHWAAKVVNRCVGVYPYIGLS